MIYDELKVSALEGLGYKTADIKNIIDQMLIAILHRTTGKRSIKTTDEIGGSLCKITLLEM